MPELPEPLPGKATHLAQDVDLVQGYVSGCPYEDPHFKITFGRLRYRHFKPLHPVKPVSSDVPEPKPLDPKDTVPDQGGAGPLEMMTNDLDSLGVSGPRAEWDLEGKALVFAYGVTAEGADSLRLHADSGIWWHEDRVLYMEGHVEFHTSDWDVVFDSLILDLRDGSGRGVNPRLVIRNPSGLLGLGRGSLMQSVVRARELVFHPRRAVALEDDRPKAEFLTEEGEAHLGSLPIMDLPEKYTGETLDFFEGAKAGRNTRHGAFFFARLSLINRTIKIGNASIRARIMASENWYQKRGWGQGIDGKYSMALGGGEGRGKISFFGIHDKDRDRKVPFYGNQDRFWAHWIHRGETRRTWDWNFELSRESDPLVRPDFDRKVFRQDKPYQNRLFLAHKGPNHRLSFLTQARAEDFYREVDYLPSIQWEQIQQPLGDFVLEGRIQAANARINHAEPRHREAPSIRALRLDIDEQFSLPLPVGAFHLEPYLTGNATAYSRKAANDHDAQRSQGGVGMVAATRVTRGVYRFLPRIDAKRLFTPSVRAEDLPQIDEVDSRKARETVDFSWKHLMRSHVGTKPQDLWDLDLRITGFPHRDRDNDGRAWSDLMKRLNMRPHTRLSAFIDSRFDAIDQKYRLFNGGFTINPDSRVDIGTGADGREIFTGDPSNPTQGVGPMESWAFTFETRYSEDNPAIYVGQIDLIPRDKWRVSYAQEWRASPGPKVILHRIYADRDLHDWTLSFDYEIDTVDSTQSLAINLSPHGWGRF